MHDFSLISIKTPTDTTGFSHNLLTHQCNYCNLEILTDSAASMWHIWLDVKLCGTAHKVHNAIVRLYEHKEARNDSLGGTRMENSCEQTICRCVEHSSQVQWPAADCWITDVIWDNQETHASVFPCLCEKMTRADSISEGVFLLCLLNQTDVHVLCRWLKG